MHFKFEFLVRVRRRAAAWAVTAAGIMLAIGSPAAEVTLPDVSLADASVIAEAPTPHLGEVREFIGRIATVDCQRWEVINLDHKGDLVSQCANYKVYMTRAESYNLHEVTGAQDKPAVVFEPAYPVVQFPLSIGKRWRKEYTGYFAIEGLRWDGDVKCEVADFEDTTVAAGTYKAFRIECHDNWKVGPAASSVDSTAWYAPAVGGVIKAINYEDSHWNFELKSVSPKSDKP